MMNTLKGLISGGKVKQQETAAKELEKAQAHQSDLQAKLSQAQSNQAKINQALVVVEASLVIDENDKAALAQQKKANSRLDELAKEIESTQVALVDAGEKVQLAYRETLRSQGDLARKHNVKAETARIAPARFNKALGLEDVYSINASYMGQYDLAQEYGMGSIDSLHGTDDWDEAVKMNNEVQKEANENAEKIARELEEAIKGVFEKNGIELDQQTLINLSRI
ncbi:hypothetical protein BK709_19035 [Bacillus thuringiensis serovar shandongiensis]|uniref:hypothetical protein n=1 Tax=Bacillus cereus group TaxID=86661 RepID=UPI000278A3F7|nr:MULTISPECIES: hypothetical protein [Bacillus cereus group]EJQ49857.1 hypothetical protein IEI_03073 [Bacillus wiedmannii]MEC2392630.1 hypothetical protein [Bacillus toyonensis]OTX40561.1 hypothetical protein BK717_04445 [Bacillus thuringiensis serovar malayensis]OUB04980.1 hypothetical protein BK709_19035 [Bacillus thuringiensis serovar shandongiensis]